MTSSTHYVDVGGRRLWAQVRGTTSPTVVLVAGGGMTGGFLQPLQARIAAFARTLIYDRPGLGSSDPAKAALSFGDHAEDLHRLLTALGERPPFVLVGESYGGLIVRTFAAAFPETVAGVVLIDSPEESHVFGQLARRPESGSSVSPRSCVHCGSCGRWFGSPFRACLRHRSGRPWPATWPEPGTGTPPPPRCQPILSRPRVRRAASASWAQSRSW